MLHHQMSNGSTQRRVRVLEVLGNAIVGGMENYVRNLVRLLPAHLFQVTCLCPYESAVTADLRRMGYSVYVIPMDEDPTLRSIQTAVGLIQSEKIDLLHAHLPRAHALAGLAGCLTHRPVITTVHGMDVIHDLSIHQMTSTHLIVICQTAYMQALALGIPHEKVSLIPNGIDVEKFKPANNAERFRETVGIPDGVPLAGFVGRFSWEKGPDQFIETASHVHKKRPDVHYVMVGEGPMQDELVQMAADRGLKDKVYMPGLWADTSEVYPAFDVLVQTSRLEGMPLALLEGMACGRPVVCMGVGGVMEIVETGTTGLLSAPGDSEGLAQALVQLVDNPEKTQNMGRQARQRVEQLFDLRTSVAQTALLFNRLAGPDLAWQTLEPFEQLVNGK